MASGKKSKDKDSSGRGEKKDNKYVTLFQILEPKEKDKNGKKNPYAKASAYKGRLIWEEQDEDGKSKGFYQINSAFIGTPHEDSPKFVLQTIVCNLNNPKAAEKLED